MNTLLIGKPGSGKTTALCTGIPPIFLIDVDGKAKQMINLQDMIKKGDLVVYEMKNRLIEDRLSYRAAHPDKGPQTEPQGYYEIIDILNDIVEDEGDYSQFNTIGLDSLTRAVEHMKRLLNYHRSQNKFGKVKADVKDDMNWPSWGTYLSNLEELFAIVTTHIKQDFICCAHERTDTEYDEMTKNTTITGFWPMIDGQMKEKLASYFNEVYYMDIKFSLAGNEYRFRIHPDRKHASRTSMDLDSFEDANLLDLREISVKNILKDEEENSE